MVERFLGERIVVHAGDCREALAALDPDSFDACVTDPPYYLSFMGQRWDRGDVAFTPELWRLVFRVLKPGAFLLAFGGTRTYHRLACAIEDAGFEIRDAIQWLYGSGLPKSHDLSRGVDRVLGAERPVVGPNRFAGLNGAGNVNVYGTASRPPETAPGSPDAAEWAGFGTALKPACEIIAVARKPLSEPSVAANVLRWGTGGLNIDACRVPVVEAEGRPARVAGAPRPNADAATSYDLGSGFIAGTTAQGRWPANVILYGSAEVVDAFPVDLVGSVSRFFYAAKADADDRIGSKHPTVKPLDLIQYLVRLVTPPAGTVLDCFAGTGTTGEAAFREGLRAVLIEREDEYLADIRRRMALALAGPAERTRESIKARQLPRDDGPLFTDRSAVLPGCDLWPGCGCGTQSGPHTCEGRVLARGGGV